MRPRTGTPLQECSTTELLSVYRGCHVAIRVAAADGDLEDAVHYGQKADDVVAELAKRLDVQPHKRGRGRPRKLRM